LSYVSNRGVLSETLRIPSVNTSVKPHSGHHLTVNTWFKGD